MSFTEWSNNKKKKKEEGATSQPTTSVATSNTTSSSSGSSTGLSFTDWSDQKKATKSAQDWVQSASNLINEAHQFYSNWNNDEEQYTRFQDRTSSLLALADGWRKQYAGNDEVVSQIDSVVSALTDTKYKVSDFKKYYSQWGSAEDYDAWYKKESFISEYLTDPEKATSALAYEADWLKEAQYRSEKSKVLGAEDFQDYSRYSSTKLEGFWDKAGSQYSMGYGDLTYEYINNQDDIRSEISSKSRAYRSDTKAKSTFAEKHYDYMTDDEVSVYNYYYAKEGRERAEEYLNSIGYILEARANNEMVEKTTAFANAHPVFSSVLSVGTSLGSGFEYIEDVLDYGADKITGKDARLGTNELALMTNTVRGTVQEKVDWEIGNWDAFDFLYSTTMSGADSLTASTVLGKFGGVALGLSAAAQGTNDALARGMSDGQAFWNGLFSGVFEGLFETISIGKFNKLKEVAPESIKDIFKNLGKSMLVNASEEALTEIANIGYDTLINGEFANYTWEELKNGAWKDALLQVLESGASGALMGIGMGTVGNTMGYAKGSSNANKAYGSNPGVLVGEALEIDPNNAFAQKMQGRLDSGKKLSGGQLMKLNNQVVKGDINSIQSAAAQRLTELGETGDVKSIAAALTKQAAGKKLSRSEQQAISNSKYAQRVANELNPENIRSGEYSSGWAENIDTQRINVDEYSRLLEAAQLPQEAAETTGDQVVTETQNEAQPVQTAAVESSTANYQQVTEEASTSQVPDDGVTRQKSTGQAITPQKIVAIEGGMVMIQTDLGTIAADDIQFGTKETDLLWRSAADFHGINTAGANGIIRAYQSGTPVTTYLNGAAQEFRNGYYNMESGGEYADKLTPMQRTIIYELGQKAAGENIAKEQAKKTAVKKSSATVSKAEKVGRVHFDRGGRTFDQKRETALKTMEQLSKALGTEFYVYESYVNEAGQRVYKDANGNEKHAPNGWYDPIDGSIHIDLNAGADGKGTMLFTIAHELTHFIKEWSPAKFKVLANFLITQYSERGMSVNQLVNAQIAKAKRSGRQISYDTAFEEVVADSMESIMADGNVVQFMADLKQQDKSLWQKICDWFKDLVSDLKAIVEAYKGVKPDSNEGKMVADMQDVIVVLESLYADALVDAGENYQAASGAQKNTTQEGGEKMSARENAELPYSIYRKLLNKKAINASRKDWAKVSGARVDAYRGMSDDSIPDIDFFEIAEYKKIDNGYIYTVRNYDKDSFEIIGKKQIKNRYDGYVLEVSNNGKVSENSGSRDAGKGHNGEGRPNSDRLPGQHGTIREDAKRSEKSRKSEPVNGFGFGDAHSGQRTVRDSADKKLSDRDSSYMEAVNRGDMETARKMVEDVAKKSGYTVRAYHGTARGDRVGNVFLPERATSGPMAFFTDNREIAESYAKSKKDTSLAYDEEYADYYSQFRVNQNGKSIKVQDLWRSLPFSEKQRLKEAGKHITWDEDMENIIWDDDATHGLGNWDAYTLNLHKGNAIEALIDSWLESGELFGSEGDFIQVLELAGIKGVEYRDPDARYEKVYDTFLNIQNPFDTATVDDSFADGFAEWYSQQPEGKYDRDTAAADMWDKNSQTTEMFLARLRDDIENNTTYAWTSIPDSMTDYLKYLGHNGIRDTGGKFGGDGHSVWIPFASEQIKSAEPVIYDDGGTVIPLSERFNAENKDIRYSDRDSESNQLSEEQKAFFAQSKARDKEGKLLVLYHGTANAGFTAFDPTKGRLGGSWFTTSRADADSYAGNYQHKLFDPNETDDVQSSVGGNYTLGSWMRFDTEADRADFLKQYPNAENIKTDAEYAELMKQAEKARDWDEYDRLEEEQQDRRNELKKILRAYGRYEWEHSREATLQELFDNPEQFSMSDVMRAWYAYDSNNSVGEDEATKEELIEALRMADRESIEQGDDTIADIRFKARLPVGQSGQIVNRANNRTYAVYANAVKPYEIDAKSRTLHEADLYPVIEAGLKDTGYDSVIVRNTKVGAHEEIGDVVIIKDAGQVKLISNKSPTAGADIHYSERDPELEKVNRVLERENTELKHDVAYLKELLKLQRQVTGGTKFTKTSVEAAARQLMKYADAKGDQKELAGLLNAVYEYIAGSKELTWDGVKEAAVPAVEWLQSHVSTRTERSAYAQNVLKQIRNSRIYLDEQQKKEVAYQYGSYNEFRRKAMGSVILTDTATMSLDSQWHEWAVQYPNLFDPDISSTDMPAALMEVFDNLRNMTETDAYGYDQELLGQELLSQVYDSYWNVSTLYTVKDKAQKEINRLKFDHAGRMATLKKYHEEQTAKLKAEHKEDLQRVRQEMRDREAAKLKKIQDQYHESRKKMSENRQKAEMRRKIRRTIMDLKKILNKGDKKRNVKEDMKDLVAQALQSADILFTDNYSNEDMVRYGVGTELTEQEAKYMTEAQDILAQIEGAGTVQERQEAENRLSGKLDYRISKLKDVFTRERARLGKAKVSEVLGNLADAYASLENSEQDYVKGAFDENVYQYLTMLKTEVGGTIVRDMSLKQLDELHKAYTMVLTTVRNANKMFAANLKQTREQLGSQTIYEVKQAGGEHGLWAPGEDKLNAFSWNNQKPVYAFERIGSETLTKLFENTRAGEDSWAQDMTEAREYYLEKVRKYKFDSWNFEKQYNFASTSGIDFSLNLEQIMSLYAYSKREQAHDHLMKGGFVFDGNTEVQVSKMGIKMSYLNKTAKAHNVSPEILGEIVSKLTAEQKAFVDEMQDYLSTTMGEKGNEVSMQMYGVKLFKEKHYFPLRSAGQYMERAKEADLKKQQGQISIVNSGFTKATTPKSSNPVVLSGFMDVWADHVNEMSMYHSFVLPMEDFRRVYNYSSPNMETGQSISVNSVIQEAYGEAATSYIDQLYRDLNGGAVSDPRENGIKALMGKFKKAAVFSSLSVVIQQPSAIGRAFAIIDPKYFIGSKVDSKRHKALWAELKKYAPVAAIKEMGYFDTGMGKSAQDFIKGKEYNTLKEKAAALFTDENYRDEVLSKAPALADELTWCAIWEAAKRETKAKNPKMDIHSEEFLQLAGKRFTEVITKTQVYDSVLSRSANMRSKGVFMSMWTAFMAEPTTTINMVEDALRKGKKGDKKYAARAMGAVLSSVILNSVLSSLIYAMRDDDEDETFLEKYVQSFTTEILDGINPLTYYPFLKDVWSALQGYDIERSDMSLITSLIDAGKTLLKVYLEDTEDMDESEQDAHNKRLAEAWWGLVDYVTAFTGVPVKNVRRDINAVINSYKTISQDLTDRDTSWGSLIDKALDAVMNTIPVVGLLSNETAADKLYKATISGDTAYQKRLASSYQTENSLNNAIRKGLRTNDSRIWEAAIAWNNNNLETYKRIAKEIIAEGNFSQDNVVAAIQAEAAALAPDDGETTTTSKAKGYFTMEKFVVAISQSNSTMAATIKADIIETAQKNGKTAEEAENSFASSAKSSLKKMFIEGGITASQAIDALTQYCGVEEDEAQEDILYWDFLMKYPDYSDLSESAVTDYYEYAASAGIGADVYYDYYVQASQCEGIKDADGNTISGSKKAEVMTVINALNITSAQKDALYYANGWAESRIHEAPWH